MPNPIPGHAWVNATEIYERLDSIDRALKPRNARVGVAALIMAAAHKAFREREFGGIKWPQRYPGLPAPFINKAAALNRLNRGLALPPVIFDRGKPLQLSGQMLQEISSDAFSKTHRGNTLEVGWGGPAKTYAGIHQLGGKTSQRITERARTRLAEIRAKASGNERQAIDAHMGFVQSQDVLVTRVNQRPAIGWTEEVKEKINMFLVEFVEGKVPGI